MDAVEELNLGPTRCAACAYWGTMQTRPLCPAHATVLGDIERNNPGFDVVYVVETGKFFKVKKDIKELTAPAGSKDGSGSGDLDPKGEWFKAHRPISVDRPGPLKVDDLIRLLKARAKREELLKEETRE